MLQGVQAGLQSLIEGGIMPRTLIIDDGWQMTAVDEDYAGVLLPIAARPLFKDVTCPASNRPAFLVLSFCFSLFLPCVDA